MTAMRKLDKGHVGHTGVTMLEAVFAAPLVAISARWPKTLHAASAPAIVKAWPDGTVTAECGVTGLRLLGAGLSDGGDLVLWPPRINRNLPLERCPACWKLTGRKRPRCEVQAIPDGRSE